MIEQLEYKITPDKIFKVSEHELIAKVNTLIIEVNILQDTIVAIKNNLAQLDERLA